ncbi:nitronate monooxygenase [Neptuniibacter sp.]|uniref:NAD(P)H-dependent flavin oxidoreductase n=1 Tax=Neptuniibacter sp. TaxID=1962643 RepID=UPI002629B830|nr:nitronate monooxygenase [Neptuniibacter sp.]MCP4595377.1 nitronate monooxygenase [Neptuniibacter sp.]
MTLQQLLGIDLPIIQAPMAGVQGSELAIAVSNAGGVGSLPCAMLSADALRKEAEAIQSQTDRPFNFNFFAHDAPDNDEAAQQRWREQLSPYYAELDIDPDNVPAGPARTPFNKEMAEIVKEIRPAVVSFHFGLPAKDLLEMVREAGSKIISSATTVEEAIWLEGNGVDAIIAQGVEAGGHRGMFLTDNLETQTSTFALLQQIINAVDLPVIAAGGIVDASCVNKAIKLGAAGVQVGTAYLLCLEAKTSAIHRAALKSEESKVTVLTNVFSGRPARGIVNRLIKEQGPISCYAPQFPLATAAVAPLRFKAESLGSGDFTPLWSGTDTSGCREIPAADLTRALFGL